MLRSRLIALIVVAASVAAGCGSASHPTTVTRTVTGATTAPATSPTATTATAVTTTPAPGENPTDLKPSHAVHETSFQSPSGNIGCVLLDAVARCDIRTRSWSPPPRPKSCPLDYGQGVQVTASGPGRLVCAGDTALNLSAPKLAYGSAATAGPDLCTSATIGITCVNERTRHGFFLSAQRYRVF